MRLAEGWGITIGRKGLDHNSAIWKVVGFGFDGLVEIGKKEAARDSAAPPKVWFGSRRSCGTFPRDRRTLLKPGRSVSVKLCRSKNRRTICLPAGPGGPPELCSVEPPKSAKLARDMLASAVIGPKDCSLLGLHSAVPGVSRLVRSAAWRILRPDLRMPCPPAANGTGR